MNKKKVIKFHKLYIVQIYGYLALIPFYFSFLALKENFNKIDIILFSMGLFFLIILLLVNQLEPVVRVTEHKIVLYNKFNNRPVTLLKSDYISYIQKNSRLIVITFRENNYEIKLNKKELNNFIDMLKGIN